MKVSCSFLMMMLTLVVSSLQPTYAGSAVVPGPPSGPPTKELPFPSGLPPLSTETHRNSSTWSTLKIGAGGFLTGIDIAYDGTKVVRTDTYGAYTLDSRSGLWQQLVTTQSMPAADIGLLTGQGVYEIRIAPSNSQRFYMYFNGYIYRSDNRGATWIRTGFAKVTADPNARTRLAGPYMAIDPSNADLVYVGTPSAGVFVTTDAGKSWSRISGVGTAAAAAAHLIAFDRASRVVSGKTQGIYVSTYGTGVYHSLDGGSTWMLTAGGPKTHEHMIVDQNGDVWLIDDSYNLHKYTGSWSHITAAGRDAHSIAVDPANANHIYIITNGGALVGSMNGGSTWFGPTVPVHRSASDIPWLGWTNENYMTAGDICFDPSAKNTIYFSEGIGVWYINPPTSNADITWLSKSAGIEQLVTNWIISPWGSSSVPVVTAWDRAIWQVTNPNVYPSTHGPNNTYAIIHGWSADWAANAPSTIVAVMDGQGRQMSGISSDGGQTWRAFTAVPADPSVGGSIAAASTTNFVWMTSNDGDPYYSTDGGVTWKLIVIDGVPPGHATGNTNGTTIVSDLTVDTSRLSVGALITGYPDIAYGTTITSIDSSTQVHISSPSKGSTTGLHINFEPGWNHAFYLVRQTVAADRVNADTFLMYNYGPTAVSSAEGFYRSTDKGVSWRHVARGQVGRYTGGNAILRSVPGQAGQYFFTPGYSSPGPWPHDGSFYRSTDGGSNWRAVSNIKEVWSFGFGRAAPGQNYPAIYIYGWVRNVGGFWRSDDNASTWKKIGDLFPTGSFDQVRVVEGDANIYGRVYVGFGGSGFAYCDCQ